MKHLFPTLGHPGRVRPLLLLLALLLAGRAARAQGLTITTLAPTRNQGNVSSSANVAVTFSQTLQNTAATLGAVQVYSQQRGGRMRNGARGTATASGNTLTFDPTNSFKPGETLLVTTTTAATSTSGATLAKGKVHQFTAATSSIGRGIFAGGSNPATSSYPTSVAVGDVDGDGDLDLLTANYNSGGTVSVRLNGGDASGSNTGVFSNGSDPAVGSDPTSVAVGDVDGDGDLDLLTANYSSGTVSVRLNGGDATGSNTGVFSGGSDPAVGSRPAGVAVGDVDGDGDLDLLTANQNSSTVSVRLNGGDATGSNTGVFSGGSDPAVGSSPTSVAVGDVDGDGDLDLLTANQISPGTVSVRLNGGDASGSNTGTFSGGSDPVVGNRPLSVAVGDVDGDGDLDLLTANYNSPGTVSVRLNGGNASGSNTGVFSNGSDPAVGRYPYSVAVGDVDGDGDLDLLTANRNSSGTASVRLNGGDASGSNTGTFSNGSNLAVGSYPTSVAVGDVDGDGDLDLLTANSLGNSVSVRLNQPPPPTISGFSPASGPVGQTVTVTGTNFTGATGVTVNGVAGTLTGTPTATSLTFTVGAGSTTGLIQVTTPGGVASSSSSFTVVLPPTISSFSPASGPVGQTVTVTGTNFTGATGLTLNGAAVSGFSVVSGTSLTFVVPAGASSGPIAVTTPGGTATSSTSFTFLPPPTITSVAPASANTGTSITVTGTGFTGATGVTLNGVTITGFTVVNGTTITFILPAGATSGPVAVTTPNGTASSSSALTVDNTPPTATLSTPANPTSISPIPFTVTFSEGVTGFSAAGLTISNGTVTPGSVSGSGATYTFTVTPTSSGAAAVLVGVGVLANAAQDAAGNPNPASGTTSVTFVPPPDLANTGTLLTVQAGGILFVGTTGFTNQSGTLTNPGTMRVDGPLANAGTLNLSSGTLEVRGDFANTGTLTPGTSAVTFSGTTNQTLTAGGATLYQVLVNKPTAGANVLTLAGDLTVSNALTLTTGLLATGPSAKVLLGPAATLSETAPGYVTGTVETTRSVSTAGTAQTFGGLGLRLTPTGATLPGSTRVRRTTGTALTGAGTSQSIKRYFDIVPAVNTGLNVTLALTYRDDELNGIAEGNLALFKSETSTAGPWAKQAGTTFDAVANTATKAGITSFSFWTLGNASNPLPVTLLDFTATAEGPSAVRLRWATAQELNNAGFTVERSTDGSRFADVGTVAGAGTSAARHDYALLDSQLPAGATLLYYRLRQTDRDGTVAYSPVRAVALTQLLTPSFTVFPTRVAAGQNARYRYTGPAGAGTLDVLSVLGQVLGTVALDGRPDGPVPLAGLATGVYFLRYTGPAGHFTSRLVVE
ncbi:FG-GAP-like repeat-containing protein [Hymenobacter sp. DH14]|uniref:FG-GAP-like repeat-containing protein n=1 Tax=Hymenobacter cyanobacteriorum TaxID=2926463 RepID=A0A9X2AG51_9BACT|nr:FG-GAP-like repeat-containing protein [Hymenobacter cyanobacteriorum]MCI1187238.1 FG-GAP-like repeat-containing protein [Hymenobacter cyanobacteriorum]